jgi:hypothetical protein
VEERKLAQVTPTADLDARFSRHCILTTGRNSLTEGLDVVVEGDAVRVTDEASLRAIAAAYESKYGREWHFDVRDRAFVHEDGGEEHVALVHRGPHDAVSAWA